MRLYIMLSVLVWCAGSLLYAQLPEAPLYFREDWTETLPETPVTQAHVYNPEVQLTLHGPAADSIKKSWHDTKPGDPYYIWSGLCRDRWAVSLQKRNALVDLSARSSIRLRAWQSGGHVLKIMLGLADGSWLVSTAGFGETPDWQVFEVDVQKLKWQMLDIDRVVAGDPVKTPDLRKVRFIGWTDLTAGGASAACTRLDWIAVHGIAVTP